jgi:hypothetical protein
LYYDQFARNEKEQTCRETSPVSEIQSKFARNEKKKHAERLHKRYSQRLQGMKMYKHAERFHKRDSQVGE